MTIAVPLQSGYASDYSHTCTTIDGGYVIDDGALYEADAYSKGNTGAKMSYKVLQETDHSDEKGYCVSWSKGTVSDRYEFRSRRYRIRISFDHGGKPNEVEARCSLYADGMPANLECDRRVVTFRFGAPERREAGWGIDNGPEAASHITVWSHNGSAMELRADGALRSFSYQSPRPQLLPYGVYPGTLLFDGQTDGRRYRGRARIFTKACGEVSYLVSGPIENNGTRVILRGDAPVLDSGCRPASKKKSELVFELRPTSPSNRLP